MSNLSKYLEKNESNLDKRSKHGKRFSFKNLFLFILMAELAGANSCRKKETYLKENRRELGLLFKEHWYKSPSHVTINDFINQLESTDFEDILKLFYKKDTIFHVDGKVMCANGTHILNVFADKTRQCIRKVSFSKGTEIQAVYNLFMLNQFEPNDWVTLDALHCQKKPLKLQNLKK